MKKFFSTTLILVLMLTLVLTSCGKKKVQTIEMLEGFKFEYTIGETPDFSGVKAKIVYNDGTSIEVGSSELTFGTLDTATPGKKDVSVTYGGFTQNFTVTVSNSSVDVGAKTLQSIEYFEGLPGKVYVGDILNFDAIKIVANYVDANGKQTEETISVGANKNIKHNGAEIDTTKAGEYTLSLTYMGKKVDVAINVMAVEVVELQIDADSVDTTIYENQEFKTEGLIAYAVYNNGGKVLVPVENLSIERVDNVVTISYGGKSVELLLSYDIPFVTAIKIATTGYENTDNKISYGDKFSTAGIVVNATYSNNTSKNLAASDYTVTHTVGEVGTGVITVTYNSDNAITATANITVLGIEKIVIDASSVTTLVEIGNSYSDVNLKVLLTLSDGTRVSRTIEDGVTVGGDTVNASKRDTYYITATYGGKTSEELAVYVYDKVNYVIAGVENSKKDFGENKADFLNDSYGYVVGDDNPFIYRLDITAVSADGLPLKSPAYTSYSEIYYEGALLEGDELEKYCEIEETNNSFDFTEEAIGKTFTIKTRPRVGVEGREEACTKELTVTIVDGYNIYEAIELNYLTNYDDFEIPDDDPRTFTQVVDSFLASKGLTRPQSMAGFVLHDDLIIERTDVPAEFFVGADRNNDFYDFMSVYSHATDKTNKTFTFYGNYYTIFSYNLPNVCAPGVANQDNTVSSGQLFRFSCTEVNATDYNIADYTTNIQNVYLRDDNPNKDVEATADRDMRGLIGMKVQFHTVNVENIRIEAFYISFFLDNDYTLANVNESIFFNSYQNQIYSYNHNPISGDDTPPAANYVPITLNVTNSKITKSGGPVILNQTEGPELVKNSKSGPQITIDDKTEIWTWVTGNEAWFKANGATAIAQQIQGLGLLLAQSGMPKTFVRSTGENGMTHPDGYYFMNMVMVNIADGTNINDILNFTGDLDGSMTIGGTKYLDMNDTVALDGVHGYGSQTVATQFVTQAMAGKKPIIINTCTDGALVIDDQAYTATPAGNTAGIADGDYVGIYFGCFGFVFSYAPFN